LAHGGSSGGIDHARELALVRPGSTAPQETAAAPVAHHPFGVMLLWPPHGTMRATKPDGKRMG